MGITDAVHAEWGTPGTALITPLACSLQGQEITVRITSGSRLGGIYGRDAVTERTTCSYGLDPSMQHVAEEGGLTISGRDDTGEARAIERPDHPFFVATLYQPQLRSTPIAPHPLLLAFVEAVQYSRRLSRRRS